MKRTHQPTQAGNPHQLTIAQHVMPRRSIARFTNEGVVMVVSLPYGTVKTRHPTHDVFCVKRLWDQKAETIGSHRIEECYQRIADAVVAGSRTFSDEQHYAISEMFYLWKARFQTKAQDSEDVYAKGVIGSALDLDQQEILERNGYVFMLEGGRIPRRFMNGIGLRIRMDNDHTTSGPTKWGVLEAIDGEFIVPDTCGSTKLLPINPKLCFAGNIGSHDLDFNAVAETNALMRSLAVGYYFARDLGACPIRKMTLPLERVVLG